MTTQTQSIIVYRNPAEQMLWEGGYLFPVIVTGVAFIVLAMWVSLLVDKLFNRFGKLGNYRGYKEHARYAGLIFAAVLSVGLFSYMTQFL